MAYIDRTARMAPLLGAALLAAALFAAARPVEAQAPKGKTKIPLTVSGEVDLWLPIFDGVIRVGDDVDPGTEIRFDTHLDLEAHPEVFDFGIGLGDIRYGKISANFLRFNAPGNKVLRRDLTYAGVSFLQPETVHSEFTAGLDRVTVSYIQNYQGAYFLAYEVGMAFFRWKHTIENRHTGTKGSERGNSSLPLTGLHAVFPLGDILQIQFGFTGVFFRTSSDDVTATDTYLELRISLAQYLQIGLGYRHFQFDGELDLEGATQGNLEFTLGGVFLTLGVKI